MQVGGEMFNNLCAPTRRALALQDLAANLPVESDASSPLLTLCAASFDRMPLR
jgi:hypothetical protein